MKKRLLLAMLLSCWTIMALAQPSYDYQKRFQVISGHVEYQLSGMTNGTKSLWWDDYGERYREETNSSETVKVGRRTEVVKNHSLSIFDGTYYYNVNMETMEGTKLHKNAVPDFSLLGSGLNDSEMEQLGEGLLKALGGKVDKKNESVLGRTCDVTQLMGATVHVYKGVTLRSVVKIKSYENREEAVKFEENVSVSSSKFMPPDHAILEDVSADVSGNEDYYEELEEEQGLLFPSGITFETFRGESERVRRKLGYTFALHDASGGEYSAMWIKEPKNTVWILVNSLENYANWREDFADDGIEYFTRDSNRMAFREDSVYDEESGVYTLATVLLVELKPKSAFIRITATPQKTKEQLIDIFNQFTM
ncbi:MAG: hypothetical protein PHS38_09770 [Bacteroidales bacterium]|nr:hypothetical protein [Bacteroidales bacterium]